MINKNFQLALSSSRAQHEDLDEPIDLWMPEVIDPPSLTKGTNMIVGSSPAGLKRSSTAVQGTQETHTCAVRHRSPQGWPGDSVGQQKNKPAVA